MSHDINRMVYAGDVPWHGLGVQLPGNGTWEEIVEAAGFYEAIEQPLLIKADGETVPDRKALVRGDTGQYLSTVGLKYEVIQFKEVAKTLVEAAGDFKAIFHTAGTLGRSGARGWLLGELPEPIEVKGDASPIRKYLLGVAGHDGLTSVLVKNVATRVVCANTLGVALGEDSATWRIHHTANAKMRLVEVGRALHQLVTSYDRFGELANTLAVTPFSDEQLVSTLDRVLPVPEDEKSHTRRLQDRATVIELFENGVGIEGPIRGTAWAAFQGWTEFLDHYRHQRLTEGQDPRLARLESIWFGSAAAMKQAALTAIMNESGIRAAA